MIERFGLAERASHLPGEPSTGERQRTALARALLNNPKLLLADEPTGNLDKVNAEIVLTSFIEFAQSGGEVLMVTHSDTVSTYAHQMTHLISGKNLEV